jgi:hypothetical protein
VAPKSLAIWIGLALALTLPIRARAQKSKSVTSVAMQDDPAHLMIAVGCRIGAVETIYRCVIDSGATHTMISAKLLKPKGPVIDVTTANGVIQVRQQEVSLMIGGTLKLKSQAFVQSTDMPEGVDVLLGQDVLRQFRSVIFDYDKHQVEFRR